MNERQVNRNVNDWRSVTIREVNPASNYIGADDANGQRIQVRVQDHPPIEQIPSPGEMWLVSRLNNDYILERRSDVGLVVGKPWKDLQAGDARVDAAGVVYISGASVQVKGNSTITGSITVTGTASVTGQLNVGAAGVHFNDGTTQTTATSPATGTSIARLLLLGS